MPTNALTYTELWPMVAIGLTILVSVITANTAGFRYILKQLQKQMDIRFELAEQSKLHATAHWDNKFQSIEDSARQWRDLELDIAKLRAELPEKYLRREDFVLHQSRIESKLDGLAVRIENLILKGSVNG